ncbi:MAG: lipopolysaccharide transport periplasmic protein LptA [Rhodocyclales bacterium]|nr:lipopolysaccharide transport periplasmic protein LptA [Rhodocyclales bacterium]
MTLRLIPLALCLLTAFPAQAEKADRNKPMLLEANRVSIDDAKKIQILEGDVVITKGTLQLKADRIVITEDQYGFQKGVAFAGKSGLARFRQKREGRDEYIEGEAERVEYNSNTEIAELFHKAWIKSGDDQIKGDYIWYDAVSEKYLVTAGEALDPKAPPQRVRAIIQPRAKDVASEPAPQRGERLNLRGVDTLTPANQ